LDEKLAGFREAGIGEVVLVEFTPTFAALTPDEFVHHVLCESIGAKDVVVGEQFAFGRGRAGRVADLVRLGEGAGFRVHPIAPVRVDGEVVSSTRIRDLIRRGEVRRAARCLGRLYGLTGTVVPGEGRGHKLGWPTANMVLPSDRVVPADGVYATRVLWGGRTWESVSYIGTRPTFGPGERRLEVAVLDTRVDLYGETIRVEFVERLRDDRAFASSDELVAWIERDVSQAREILRAHPQPVPGG
jgi:riboflavin kinase/FMN adenylyltransferase